MQGKKELLSRIMHRAHLFQLLKEVRRDMIVIFGWHRVIPDVDAFATPFADDVLGPRVSELEAAIAWFARNVNLLSEADLIDAVQGRKRPRGLSVVISFDDGYADNYTLAYPVLKRHGVPAIFFVPTDRIERRDLSWVDLIPYAIKHTAKRRLGEFRLPEQRHEAVSHYHKRMQLEPHAATRGLVASLYEELEVEPPSSELQDRQLMTWEQLREVANDGIAIGSHTCSHYVLATLDRDQQRDELIRSKRTLEERLGRPARTIAYPVGGYKHFDGVTQALAREAGYDLGLSYCTGFNRFGAIEPFDVKRIGPPLSISLLAGTTVLPEVFDWDKESVYSAGS